MNRVGYKNRERGNEMATMLGSMVKLALTVVSLGAWGGDDEGETPLLPQSCERIGTSCPDGADMWAAQREGEEAARAPCPTCLASRNLPRSMSMW